MPRTPYSRSPWTVQVSRAARWRHAPAWWREIPAMDARAILTMTDMGMHHEGMDHSQMDPAAMPRVSHAPAESGPIVDMRASMPNTSLADPGIGLRGNGRRVLHVRRPLDDRRLLR
jgi:uncharacterized protein involved in copper resistance